MHVVVDVLVKLMVSSMVPAPPLPVWGDADSCDGWQVVVVAAVVVVVDVVAAPVVDVVVAAVVDVVVDDAVEEDEQPARPRARDNARPPPRGSAQDRRPVAGVVALRPVRTRCVIR